MASAPRLIALEGPLTTERTVGSVGLVTNLNQLAEQGDGALEVADNVILERGGVVMPRRGFESLVSRAAANVTLLAVDTLIHTQEPPDDGSPEWLAFPSPAAIGANPRSFAALGGFETSGQDMTSQLGSIFPALPADGQRRMHAEKMKRRLHLATKHGLVRIDPDSIPTTLRRSGPIRPSIDWNHSFAAANAAGPIAADSAVAYRASIATKDWKGVELEGAPSGRAIIRNPAPLAVNAASLVRTGGALVTATTTSAHGLRPGQVITLSPGEVDFAAGAKTVTTVPSPTSFTYAEAGSNVVSAAPQTFSVGAAAGSVRISLLDGYGSLEAGDLLRLFRSPSVSPASAEPGDDVYLASEVELTSSDLSTGYVVITDLQPESLLRQGGAAYFATSQEGPAAENGHAPGCRDVAQFDGKLWVGGLVDVLGFDLRLVATGGSSGLVPGTLFHLWHDDGSSDPDGVNQFAFTFTGEATAPTGAFSFTVFDTGVPFDDVERTALSLVATINSSPAAAEFRAKYLSASDELPGRIRIEEVGPAQSKLDPFTVWVSARGSAFGPPLPVWNGKGANQGRVISGDVNHPARAAWSKLDLPHAFTPSAFVDVGEDDDAFVRFAALDDRLLVFKKRSLWAIWGEEPYRIDRLDATLGLVARDSVVIMDGAAYALTTKGVVAVGSGGIDYDVGQLIYDAPLRRLLSAFQEGLDEATWGAALPFERRYVLALPTASNPTAATTGVASVDSSGDRLAMVMFVFNAASRAWSRWPRPARIGATTPDGRLSFVVGVPAIDPSLILGGMVTQRARNLSSEYGDGIDEAVEYLDGTIKTSVSVVSASGLQAGINGGFSWLAVGQLLRNISSPNAQGVIMSIVGVAEGITTVLLSAPIATGSTEVFQLIPAHIRWHPSVLGAPEALKQLEAASVHFKAKRMATGSLKVATDKSGTLASSIVVARTGYTPGAAFVDDGLPRNQRALIPREKGLGVYFSVDFALSEALSYFELQGLSLIGEVLSDRESR